MTINRILRRLGPPSAFVGLIGLLVIAVPAGAATITVPAGGDLQAALKNAQPGDVINLQPGATYIGSFTLPNKGGSSDITLQTSPAGLPVAGSRISPSQASSLAKVQSPTSEPALKTAAGAHHWRIVLVEVLANRGGAGDIIDLGDGSSAQNTLARVPHDLVIDRCYIHAAPGAPQKRGIALNSASTTVTGSYIAEIKAVGQDSQAILGWNGPGPFTITNNYLEAAGENVMFGGADPEIPDLVPSNITIENNTFAKQPSWRSANWSVKNLLELKNARRVGIRGNTFEYNWQAGQSGFAVLFTVRNQSGACPWCQVEEVTFEHNVVRHSAAGLSILGTDNLQPSRRTRAITVRDNLFADIDNQTWGGNGYFLQLIDGPADVTIDHNTIIQNHASGLMMIDEPVSGFTFTNNLARHNLYGIFGSGHAPGLDTIKAYLPNSIITNNVIADADAKRYPTGNSFPTSSDFRSQFVSYDNDDYRLIANSPWRGAGTDGRDLGAALGSGGSVTPPSPISKVRIFVDTPVNGQTLSQPFEFGGWAIDTGATSTTGIDAVHVWAYPNPGSGASPIFVGQAAYGLSRPDVARTLSDQFTGSGYGLTVQGLAPGSYQFVAYAHSAIANAFTAAPPVAITIRQSASMPRMAVDLPRDGANVPPTFAIAGWALDLGSNSGSGVDGVDVWAYPNPGSGAAPVFLGSASYGSSQPAVGEAFGARFSASSYGLTAAGLSPGTYQIVVYAHSVVAGTFNNAMAITVHVVGEASQVQTFIDTPAPGSTVHSSFLVAGWTFDQGASSGPGIDTVHVWAQPVGGGTATFLGVASYGGVRPDVGNAFGAQFAASAFGLNAGGLAPGAYDIIVYPHSSVAHAFNGARVVRVTVVP